MQAATARINALGTRIFGGTNPYLLMSLPALVVMLALFTITAICARIASAFTARNIGRWKEYSGRTIQVNPMYHGLDDQDAHTVY